MLESLNEWLAGYHTWSTERPHTNAVAWAVALLGVWWVLLRGIRWLIGNQARRMSGKPWLREGLRFRSWEIISAATVQQHLNDLGNGLYAIIRAGFALGYVLILLLMVPETADYSARTLAFLGERLLALGLDIVVYLPSLLYIVVVSFLTIQFIKLLKAFMEQIELGKLTFPLFPPEYAAPTRQIVTFFAVVFAMVLIAPYLPGSGTQAFQAVTLFIGVLVSLGSSTAVANLIASFVLQYMRAFRVGDLIEVGGHVGTVQAVHPFTTRLRTATHEYVAIPNTLMLTGTLTNYTQSAPVALKGSVSIGYDVPWTRVYEALHHAAALHADVLHDPAPYVLQRSLDDYYICYDLYAFTNAVQKIPAARSRLHECIRDAFDAAGIEILSPAHTHLHGKIALAESPQPPAAAAPTAA